MYPKIKTIEAHDDYVLLVQFENGTQKQYDFKKKFDNPAFQGLRDRHLFNQVKVDVGGYGISWNDDLDLSEFELWQNGVTCN